MAPTLKRVFLVHGELPAQQVLARAIHERYGLPVEIPVRGQKFFLESADGEDFAAEGDLSGHGEIAANWNLT